MDMESTNATTSSTTPTVERRDLKLKVTEVIPHVLFAGRTNLVFVEVRTDAGIAGLGEASLEGKTEAVVGAINDVKEYLIGQDPTRIEHHWQTIYRHSFWRGGVVIGSAISGIEQALWDILGKALGVPVYELLGGRVRDRSASTPTDPAATPLKPSQSRAPDWSRRAGARSSLPRSTRFRASPAVLNSPLPGAKWG
jgi:galactonate dehydratase